MTLNLPSNMLIKDVRTRRRGLERTSLSRRFLIIHVCLFRTATSIRCCARPVYQNRSAGSFPVGVCSTKEVPEIDARRSTWRRITLQIYSMTTIVKGSWEVGGTGSRGSWPLPISDARHVLLHSGAARRQVSKSAAWLAISVRLSLAPLKKRASRRAR